MSVSEYLKKKYGMADNTDVPISFIGEELHLEDVEECITVAKSYSDIKIKSGMLAFPLFCMIVEKALEVGY